MARCGCTSSCSCAVVAGDGVTVTGNGSSGAPYQISAAAPVAGAELLGTGVLDWDDTSWPGTFTPDQSSNCTTPTNDAVLSRVSGDVDIDVSSGEGAGWIDIGGSNVPALFHLYPSITINTALGLENEIIRFGYGLRPVGGGPWYPLMVAEAVEIQRHDGADQFTLSGSALALLTNGSPGIGELSWDPCIFAWSSRTSSPITFAVLGYSILVARFALPA